METVRAAPPDTNNPVQPSTQEYQAFVSYAREDARIARKLHRALEAYHLPPGFGRKGIVPSDADGRVLYPCFLDSDELRGGGLPDQIREALRRSGALVVVCSRASAANEWVNAEISEFLDGHSADRIFPVLVDDATLLEDDVEGLFPTALRLALPAKAATLEPMTHWQPLAADLRQGRDGFSLAVLKLVAGMRGLKLRDLAERQFRRARLRRLALSTAMALMTIVGARFLGNTIYSTGNQEIHSRADNAIAQLAAWQRLEDIISMGDVQQSQKALLGFNAECNFSFGVCGYYDEEFGYTGQRIRMQETNGMAGDGLFRMLIDLRAKIIESITINHRVDADTESPDGFHGIFYAYGFVLDRKKNYYFYKYRSIDQRGKYYRLSYALIPFDAVPDIHRGEAIKTWGIGIPIMLFGIHLLVEVVRFGRLFNSRVVALKSAQPR